MAHKITDACLSCGTCVPECPVEAISEGDPIYTIDASKCTDCGACRTVCPAELDVPKEVGGPECIACGDCIGACPQQGIKRRFGL